MNTLLSKVKALMRKVFPKSMILLTQCGKTGDSLLRSVAANAIPVLNVKTRSVTEHMHDVWNSTNITSAHRPAESLDCVAVMLQVLSKTKKTDLYRVGNHVEWKTAEVFASELNAYHDEGVGPDKLDAVGYSDLATVYREYLTALGKAGLLLPMQIAEIIPASACGPVISILGNVPVSGAERVFLQKAGSIETINLPVPSDEDLPRRRYNKRSGDNDVVNWPLALKSVPNLECVTAQTLETEYQGIIRSLLEKRIRAENAAVVCYSQEQSERIWENADAVGIGCTTAFGRSMRNAQVMTVLKAILDWADDNYDQTHLVDVLRSNMMNDYDLAGTRLANGNDMMKAIIACEIGWGADRYKKMLSKPLPGETKREKENREHAAELFLSWINLLTGKKAKAHAIGISTIQLLKSSVRTMGNPRTIAEFARLTEIIKSITQAVGEEITPREFLEYVYEAAVDDVFDVGGDEPGKLYICRYHEALMLNRSVFFVPGLTMKAFDKPSGESPLVPDRVREVLSPTVPQSGDDMRARRFALKELLMIRSGDRFILSWPERDNLNGDKNNPSVIFRDASEMAGTVIQKVVPNSWMTAMDRRLRAGQSSLNDLTGFAGIDAATLSRLTDNLTVSVSKLEESLCVCVRRYFLENILKVTLPEELPNQFAGEWLDPLAAGNFLHAVLEQYMKALSGKGVRVDMILLKDCFDEQLKALKGKYPLPVHCSKERRERQLGRLWNMVVNVAEKYGTDPERQFTAAEVPFRTAPVKMKFGSHEINFVGKIDRVDYIPSTGKYEVIDYKTKDPSGFSLEGKLQLYVYARAWESLNPGKLVSAGHYYVLGKGSGGLDDVILSDREMTLDKATRDNMEEQIEKALVNLKSLAGCLSYPDKKEPCKYCKYKKLC